MAGVDRYEDLLVWKLTFELSVRVFQATDQPPASRDFRFANQIRDASDSAQRNVAEGFGRFGPVEFARFLDIVRSSLNETLALLEKGAQTPWLSRRHTNRARRPKPDLRPPRAHSTIPVW